MEIKNYDFISAKDGLFYLVAARDLYTIVGHVPKGTICGKVSSKANIDNSDYYCSYIEKGSVVTGNCLVTSGSAVINNTFIDGKAASVLIEKKSKISNVNFFKIKDTSQIPYCDISNSFIKDTEISGSCRFLDSNIKYCKINVSQIFNSISTESSISKSFVRDSSVYSSTIINSSIMETLVNNSNISVDLCLGNLISQINKVFHSNLLFSILNQNILSLVDGGYPVYSSYILEKKVFMLFENCFSANGVILPISKLEDYIWKSFKLKGQKDKNFRDYSTNKQLSNLSGLRDYSDLCKSKTEFLIDPILDFIEKFFPEIVRNKDYNRLMLEQNNVFRLLCRFTFTGQLAKFHKTILDNRFNSSRLSDFQKIINKLRNISTIDLKSKSYKYIPNLLIIDDNIINFIYIYFKEIFKIELSSEILKRMHSKLLDLSNETDSDYFVSYYEC